MVEDREITDTKRKRSKQIFLLQPFCYLNQVEIIYKLVYEHFS